MATKEKLAQLHASLQQAQLSPEERCVADELLEKAAHGNDAAFRQIERAVREGGRFAPMAGEDPARPPGSLFVCPVDPAHYRVYQREVGEDLTCPKHGVPLRQADSGE